MLYRTGEVGVPAGKILFLDLIGVTKVFLSAPPHLSRICVTDAVYWDRTTSVPKSVLRYELDKVRSLNLESLLLLEELVTLIPLLGTFFSSYINH